MYNNFWKISCRFLYKIDKNIKKYDIINNGGSYIIMENKNDNYYIEIAEKYFSSVCDDDSFTIHVTSCLRCVRRTGLRYIQYHWWGYSVVFVS